MNATMMNMTLNAANISEIRNDILASRTPITKTIQKINGRDIRTTFSMFTTGLLPEGIENMMTVCMAVGQNLVKNIGVVIDENSGDKVELRAMALLNNGQIVGIQNTDKIQGLCPCDGTTLYDSTCSNINFNTNRHDIRMLNDDLIEAVVEYNAECLSSFDAQDSAIAVLFVVE